MLSVCIIAKNEEKNISQCLNSIKDIADEIVLVDTGSEDNTLKIAQDYNCKIIEKVWNDDFAEMRNISINNAIEDFILYIDADEILNNPTELLNSIKNSDTKTGGFYVSVVSSASNNKQFYSNLQVRLFRNNLGFQFEGAIHEQIQSTILAEGYKIDPSKIQITHTGYDVDEVTFIKKQNRNLKILKKVLETEPNNTFQRINLAKTYYALKEYKSAESEIKRIIETHKLNDLEKVLVLNQGALIAYKLNKIEIAYSRAKVSTEILSQQFLANFIIAEISLEKKSFNDAIDFYKKSMEINNNSVNKLIGDMLPNKTSIHYKTGLAYLQKSDFKNAKAEFKKGLEYTPNDLQNLTGLANAYFKEKNYSASLEILYEAKKYYQNVNELDKFILNVKSKMPKKEKRNNDKPLLTLSMIVKNEEKFLEGCLKSAQNIVDEIVIVDTGSTDKTKEIAYKYTDKVFDFEWIDDFASARNEALKHSTGEWILYMDADERLQIKYTEMFHQLLQNAGDDIGALVVTIESDHKKLDGSSEKHRGGYPRIFRNFGYPKIKFQGRVHEQIAPSILELDKSFLDTDIIIEHLGYNREFEEMDKKVRRNYKLLLQHVKEEPLNGYAWYQLGQTLAHMNLKEQAEDAIKFAIETGNLKHSVYASACATLSQMTGNRKEFEQSLYYAEESLKKAPDQVYSLNLRAYSLLYLGKKAEAERDFLKVLELMKQKKGIPKSGFDIDIPESIVIKGLEKSRE